MTATIVAGAALAGLGCAPPASTNTKTACIYTQHSLAKLQQFETTVGRPINCIIAFTVNPDWANWVNPWFARTTLADSQLAAWVRAAPTSRRLVMTLEMVPSGVSSTTPTWPQLGAGGAYDSYIRQLAANLVSEGLGSSIIRLSHEMNGTWYADGLGSQPATYAVWAQYWARIATTMKATPGAHFEFDWNVNSGYRNIPFPSYYPGDAAVDIIGMDLYDQGVPNNPTDPATRWTALTTEGGGLNGLIAFATTHHKPLSIPEWGLVAPPKGIGDNPVFVNNLAAVIKANTVRYQSYFDNTTNNTLLLQNIPLSLSAWISHFGANGDVAGTDL